MSKNIKIDKSSTKEKKLLADFENIRLELKERVELYQRMPDAKKELWLSRDQLLGAVFEYAQLLMRGKNDN